MFEVNELGVQTSKYVTGLKRMAAKKNKYKKSRPFQKRLLLLNPKSSLPCFTNFNLGMIFRSTAVCAMDMHVLI